MKVKINPCVRKHTQASQDTHVGLSMFIKANRKLIRIIGCEGFARMPESAGICRWTQGCHICTACLWLNPFSLVKISRGAAAERTLHEHFPQARTSCTAVEPACCAAHWCSRSSAPQKASATRGTFSPAAWYPSQNCGTHKSCPHGHHSHTGSLTQCW